MSQQTSQQTPADATRRHDDDGEERQDLVDALRKHRALLHGTATQLTDEQATATPTVSTLSIAGLVKHVAATEREWCRFVTEGPAEVPDIDWTAIDWSAPPPEVVAYQDQFRLLEGETLAGVLEDAVAAGDATEALVRTVDLAARQPLPVAPWFAPGATWSARRVFTHLVAEIAQHAGHADLIRETIDGRKSMG